MRRIEHWTPKYIVDRLGVFFYEKKYPDRPWLTQAANEFLESYLSKSDIGLEFGSGRSTKWFAKHVSYLTSVEHDLQWADTVRQMLNKDGVENIDYNYFPKDKDDNKAYESDYVKVTDRFDKESLDFVLVDGIYRDYCVLNILDKVRPGGIIIIDNVNWFLPSNSLSLASRTYKDGPNGETWVEISKIFSGWRKYWSSSGVSDTAVFFKPSF